MGALNAKLARTEGLCSTTGSCSVVAGERSIELDFVTVLSHVEDVRLLSTLRHVSVVREAVAADRPRGADLNELFRFKHVWLEASRGARDVLNVRVEVFQRLLEAPEHSYDLPGPLGPLTEHVAVPPLIAHEARMSSVVASCLLQMSTTVSRGRLLLARKCSLHSAGSL